MTAAPKWVLHNTPYQVKQMDDEPLKNNLVLLTQVISSW